MNHVTIVGNVTDAPEIKYTPSGAAVANFTVAVNRRTKNGDQWEDKLEGFFRCTVWREQAEHVAEIEKGTRVIVTGALQQRSWETNDGQKRSVVGINVEEVGVSLRWASVEVKKS